LNRRKRMYIVLPNYDSFPFDGVRTVSHLNWNYVELQFNVNGCWESLACYESQEEADAVKREIVQSFTVGNKEAYYLNGKGQVEPIWLQ